MLFLFIKWMLETLLFVVFLWLINRTLIPDDMWKYKHYCHFQDTFFIRIGCSVSFSRKKMYKIAYHSLIFFFFVALRRLLTTFINEMLPTIKKSKMYKMWTKGGWVLNCIHDKLHEKALRVVNILRHTRSRYIQFWTQILPNK